MQSRLYQRSYSREQQAHSHAFHQLVLPVTGGLQMEIGHRRGDVSSNTLAVVHAGETHAFAADGDNRFVVLDLPVQPLSDELLPDPGFVPFDAGVAHYIACLDHQLKQSATSPALQQQMQTLLLQLIQTTTQSAAPGRNQQRVMKIQQWLQSHFHQTVSLAFLADQVNWSSGQLSRQFKALTGVSPLAYQLELRMNHAAFLLESSAFSIQQVAERVGYQDLSAFSHRFRAHFGCSPSGYRQQQTSESSVSAK